MARRDSCWGGDKSRSSRELEIVLLCGLTVKLKGFSVMVQFEIHRAGVLNRPVGDLTHGTISSRHQQRSRCSINGRLYHMQQALYIQTQPRR